METKQGFTFTRRASNRVADIGLLKIETSEMAIKDSKQDNKNESNDFIFRKVSKNPLIGAKSKQKKNVNTKKDTKIEINAIKEELISKECSNDNIRDPVVPESICDIISTEYRDTTGKEGGKNKKVTRETNELKSKKKQEVKKERKNCNAVKITKTGSKKKVTKFNSSKHKNVTDLLKDNEVRFSTEEKSNLPHKETNLLPLKKVESTNHNQSILRFNVIKKRKTIQLDGTIDLTSDSILVEPTVENSIEGAPDKTIRLDIPVIADKVKSNEIYKSVHSNNVNDLIKECVRFLQEETSYSKEIVKHCNCNYFSDIDYRKELEFNNTKVEHLKQEINKWKRIQESEREYNEVTIPEIQNKTENTDEINAIVSEEKKLLLAEFEEKSRRLQSLDEKLRIFLENAREKSECLLRNVFETMEEKSVDAVFLLKAMSRLGR